MKLIKLHEGNDNLRFIFSFPTLNPASTGRKEMFNVQLIINNILVKRIAIPTWEKHLLFKRRYWHIYPTSLDSAKESV